MYRTFFYRIPVVPHIFPRELCGHDYCGREPALPAFSTGAHPLKCVGAVSCLDQIWQMLAILRRSVVGVLKARPAAICEAIARYARLAAGCAAGDPKPTTRRWITGLASQTHCCRWVANTDLVELELRTYLNIRTYNSFEMLKYHERNNLEISKSENCCILGKSRKILVKSGKNLAKFWQIL